MTPPLSTIDRLAMAFDQACQAAAHDYVECWYTLAGRAVRMRIVGRALAANYQRSFAHLSIPPQPATAAWCTIDLWDEEVTGIPCPPHTIDEATSSPREGIATHLSYIQEARVARYILPESASWLDRAARRLLGWHRHGRWMPLGEQTRPLAPLLSIWHHDLGLAVMHAGLVSRHGRGVLFGGSGGAGKSTATLACLCHGFDYLGDDRIAVQETGEGRFIGYSLFNTARVEASHLARFPLLHPHAITSKDPDDPKAMVVLSPIMPRQIIPSAQIHAIVLPLVRAIPRSRRRPAGKGETLLRIARGTLLEVQPSAGQGGLRLMARLAEQVPAYWLELGRDIATIPEQVEAICEG